MALDKCEKDVLAEIDRLMLGEPAVRVPQPPSRSAEEVAQDILDARALLDECQPSEGGGA